MNERQAAFQFIACGVAAFLLKLKGGELRPKNSPPRGRGVLTMKAGRRGPSAHTHDDVVGLQRITCRALQFSDGLIQIGLRP